MKGDRPAQFTIGVAADGRVIIDFGTAVPVDHILMTREQTLAMVEGLVEAAHMTTLGREGLLLPPSLGR